MDFNGVSGCTGKFRRMECNCRAKCAHGVRRGIPKHPGPRDQPLPRVRTGGPVRCLSSGRYPSNVHFFSRSPVATDMPDLKTLNINTADACLAGTGKHVSVPASVGAHVREIAEMCFANAVSGDAFRDRLFRSFNINHFTPPLRIAEEAFAVLEQTTRHGSPVQANVFGQMGPPRW